MRSENVVCFFIGELSGVLDKYCFCLLILVVKKELGIYREEWKRWVMPAALPNLQLDILQHCRFLIFHLPFFFKWFLII